MAEPESLPYVLAMLACDVAITEAGSTKKTLVGLFDKIAAVKAPATHRPFWLYAKLADLRGEHQIRLALVHLASEKEIFSIKAQTKSPIDSTDYFEFAVPVPMLTFEKEGAYEFQLFCDGVYIGRTIITLLLNEEVENA